MPSFVVDFAAGGLSGAMAKTITAPLDRAHAVMQSQMVDPQDKRFDGFPVDPDFGLAKTTYTGHWNFLSQSARELGALSLWRGNMAHCAPYIPNQAFNFAFKDYITKCFPQYDRRKEFGKFFYTKMLSGLMAGSGALLIAYPLDLASAAARLNCDEEQDRPVVWPKAVSVLSAAVIGATAIADEGLRGFGLVTAVLAPAFCELSKSVHAMRRRARRFGILSVYSGISISLIGIVAYRFAWFSLYDVVKHSNPRPKSRFAEFGASQLVTLAAGLASYPFDTIRRYMQKYPTISAIEVVRRLSFAELFEGWADNVMYKALSTALALLLSGTVQTILSRPSKGE